MAQTRVNLGAVNPVNLAAAGGALIVNVPPPAAAPGGGVTAARYRLVIRFYNLTAAAMVTIRETWPVSGAADSPPQPADATGRLVLEVELTLSSDEGGNVAVSALSAGGAAAAVNWQLYREDDAQGGGGGGKREVSITEQSTRTKP
jgi:hypothetical protein